jgi:hypothetical protein
MDSKVSCLLDALEQAGRLGPDDLVEFIQNLPGAGALPTPWETWTLIGLIRHRDRQYWVREIIQNRLRGDSAMLGALGALGHPEGVKQSGSVPGMTEWEYFFHKRTGRGHSYS